MGSHTHARDRRSDAAGLRRRLPKTHRRLADALIAAGATWAPAAKSKTAIYPAGNGPVVFLHSTPSDHRALRNDRAQLRRAGLHI